MIEVDTRNKKIIFLSKEAAYYIFNGATYLDDREYAYRKTKQRFEYEVSQVVPKDFFWFRKGMSSEQRDAYSYKISFSFDFFGIPSNANMENLRKAFEQIRRYSAATQKDTENK